MHDTSSVGPLFWTNLATKWCAGLPACALPLTRYTPSSSMGLYDAAFLYKHQPALLTLKNANHAPATKWKARGFGWEDKLIKLCDAESPDAPVRRFTRQCHNSTLGRRTCMCSTFTTDDERQAVYGEGSALRQVWRFGCADVVKYKANFQRNRTLVMSP